MLAEPLRGCDWGFVQKMIQIAAAVLPSDEFSFHHFMLHLLVHNLSQDVGPFNIRPLDHIDPFPGPKMDG